MGSYKVKRIAGIGILSAVTVVLAFISNYIPGLAVNINLALIHTAPQLPIITYEAPRKVIGKNTMDSMNSAAIYGTASMIDGLVKKIERELGYPTIKLATGGLQELVTPYCEIPFLVDQEILLYGLYKIYVKSIWNSYSFITSKSW